ncbi:MAG TPA: hypothetical protein PLT47_08935 [Bacteroidales bacterium]|nr:hypothetical protein [Bacteroidales bacterium]HQI70861.1 hypothetical protein [Bacteroidales bacterium]
MKKNNLKICALLMLSCLFLSSCQKEGVKVFKGDYTYKTSGKITVSIGGIPNPVKLLNQTGQMDIIDIGEDDRVMVVKTSLTGNVTSGYATIDGDQITFDPVTSTETIILLVENGTATITSHASGKIYDEKTIIINETYDGIFGGQGSYLNVTGTISGDSILTVAERNEDD